MKPFIIALLFVSAITNADVYKCVRDDKLMYQDRPCDAGSVGASISLRTTKEKSMEGCYSVDFQRLEGGSADTETFRVSSAGNGEYNLWGGKQLSEKSVAMKVATPEELKLVGDGFDFVAKDGVSMKFTDDTPNQKPIGFYRGVTRQGEEVIFAFFFIANAIAIKIPCP